MSSIASFSSYLGNVFPSDWIAPLEDALDNIGIDIGAANMTWDSEGMRIQYIIHILDDLSIDLPLIPGTRIEIESQDDFSSSSGIVIEVGVSQDGIVVTIEEISIRLILSSRILKAYQKTFDRKYEPVIVDDQGSDSGHESDESENYSNSERVKGFSIDIVFPLLVVESSSNIRFEAPQITVPYAAMIGDTGIILDFSGENSSPFELILCEQNSPTKEGFEEISQSIETNSSTQGEDTDNQEGSYIEVNFDTHLPANFRGVKINHSTIYYQKQDFNFPPITFRNTAIGSGGFWGEVLLGDPSNSNENLRLSSAGLSELFDENNNPRRDHNPETGEERGDRQVSEEADQNAAGSTTLHSVYPVNILGMKAALQYFGIGFRQSIPEWGIIQGFIYMPFTNKWVRLKASIGGPKADFMFEMGGVGNEGLINLETDIFKITADSIAYELKNGINYAIVSGKIKLKQPEALNIPELKVNKVSIGSDGSIAIDGGWVRAPEQINLNFFGFNIGIREFGLGELEGTGTTGKEKEQSKRQWLGFSGEVQLLEGLPIKGSVDGLKISWLKHTGKPLSTLEVSLRGIGVELEIKNTLYFKGEVNYDETTNLFKGQIRLKLISLRMEVDAQLMIGKTRDAQGREFGVFYIYLSATLPVALPLGATGTGLYGIKGLVGINVSPTKTNEQKWYEWYKADPAYDIVTTRKWQAQYDNFAFGAGIQLGTIYDNGTTFNLGAMLVVLIPGPVIMLEGKANLLKVRNPKTDQQKEEEGALYLLAVLDCRAGTFEFLLDVRYSLADIVSINGSLEVFFDFNNDQNWYIYLGRKDPESKRIQATVLTFLSANAYFMISPKAIMLGSAAGLDIRKSWGPVSFVLVAKVGFDVAIFFKPFQLEGQIFLVAEIALSVFGFGFRLLLEVILAGKVPNPFLIQGKARVHLGLPWPLPSIGFDMELKWEGKQDPQPVPRLLKGVSFMHHKASNYAENGLIGDTPVYEENPPGSIPVVPVDGIPVLNFHKRINNLKAIGSDTPLLPAYPYDDVAGTRFRYELNDIILEEYSNNSFNPVRNGVNQVATENTPSFTIAAGNGRAEEEGTSSNFVNGSDAQEPAIMLWKYGPTPFASSYQLDTLHTQHPPCEERLVLAPELVDWKNEPLGKQYAWFFTHQGVLFQHLGSKPVLGTATYVNYPAIQKQTLSGFFVSKPGSSITKSCLHIAGDTIGVRIIFPEPIVNVKLTIWPYKPVAEAGVFKASGYSLGSPVGELTTTQTQAGSLTITSAINQTIDSILFTPVDYYMPDLWIDEITYYKKKHEVYIPNNKNQSPTPDRPTENEGIPFLKPNTTYRLTVKTSAKKNDSEVYSHRETAWFRTDEGPGIQPDLTYKDNPIAQAKTYVKDTFPTHGALTHYCDYAVRLTFNERYFPKLYDANQKVRLRILDRNGKVVIEEGPGKKMLMFRLDDDSRRLSWLQGVEKGKRSSDVCKTQPTKAQFLPSSVLPTGDSLKPSTLYFAELVAGNESNPTKLYDFQFTTSKYRNFIDFMASGATQKADSKNGSPVVLTYTLTEVNPILFPNDLQAQTIQVLAVKQQLATIEWLSLNKPVKKVIRNQDSPFGSPGQNPTANGPLETIKLLPPPILTASHLMAVKALSDFRRVRHDFRSTCSKSFEEINKAIEKAFEFKVVNEKGELSTVDMKDRHLPDKVEFISIPIEGSPSDIILLMESPEPIQFDRINMEKADPKQVSFISNKDQTRAFVIMNGSPRLSISSEFSIIYCGQSDGENVLSTDGKNSVQEEVLIQLKRNHILTQ